MSNGPQPDRPGQMRAPIRLSTYGGHTRQEVAKFIEGRSPEEVQALIDTGTLSPTGQEYAREWMGDHRAKLQEADRAEELALYRRSVKAAEDSAEASRDATRSARASARAAWAAVGISVAALFVAAWPHMPWSK